MPLTEREARQIKAALNNMGGVRVSGVVTLQHQDGRTDEAPIFIAREGVMAVLAGYVEDSCGNPDAPGPAAGSDSGERRE